MSLGPSEERGFVLWVGYDIEGSDADLTALGLINVDGWNDARLKELGVTTFRRVSLDDPETRAKLGLA